MIEVLSATIVLFAFFLPIFILIQNFKGAKIIMLSIQLIFSFALQSNSFYKYLPLYKGSRIQYIQSLNFYQ